MAGLGGQTVVAGQRKYIQWLSGLSRWGGRKWQSSIAEHSTSESPWRSMKSLIKNRKMHTKQQSMISLKCLQANWIASNFNQSVSSLLCLQPFIKRPAEGWENISFSPQEADGPRQTEWPISSNEPWVLGRILVRLRELRNKLKTKESESFKRSCHLLHTQGFVPLCDFDSIRHSQSASETWHTEFVFSLRNLSIKSMRFSFPGTTKPHQVFADPAT